ncbi:hypothetical protein C8R43DRAFT_1240338 [Mycena crocata]|nr:hypothetical protein C8R43DRAFT_1240338 [Mycena crocata]
MISDLKSRSAPIRTRFATPRTACGFNPDVDAVPARIIGRRATASNAETFARARALRLARQIQADADEDGDDSEEPGTPSFCRTLGALLPALRAKNVLMRMGLCANIKGLTDECHVDLEPTPPAALFPPKHPDSRAFTQKGLPLEAALWTFISKELPDPVSRAIRSSSSESSIRVLSVDNLDRSLPAELERLNAFKAVTQSKCRFTMLLQSLHLFCGYNDQERDAALVANCPRRPLSATSYSKICFILPIKLTRLRACLTSIACDRAPQVEQQLWPSHRGADRCPQKGRNARGQAERCVAAGRKNWRARWMTLTQEQLWTTTRATR